MKNPYSPLQEEMYASRQCVALFPAHFAPILILEGSKALQAAEQLFTSSISTLLNGQSIYTFMLNEHGFIMDALMVYRIHETKLLLYPGVLSPQESGEWIKSQLKSQLSTDSIRVHSDPSSYARVALLGPRAVDVMEFTFGPSIRSVRPLHFLLQGELLLARSGYETGEDGFDIFLPADKVSGLQETLLQKGKIYKMPLCSRPCFESLRFEASVRLHPEEIKQIITPLEAGFSQAIAWEKKVPFMGQNALLAHKRNPLLRKRTGFILEQWGIAQARAPIRTMQSENIGTLCVGAWAPFLNQALAIGYVPSCLSPIQALCIEVHNRWVPAKIKTLPFYTKERLC